MTKRLYGFLFSIVISLSVVSISYAVPEPTQVSDTWDILLSKSNQLRKKRLFDSALVIGNLALSLAIETNGQVDSSVALVLHRIGTIYMQKGDPKSVDFLERANAIWQEIPDVSPLGYAKTLNMLGIVYVDFGRYAEAEQMQTKALSIKKEVVGLYHPSTASSYSNLSKLYTEIRKYALSEKYARNAIQIYDSLPNYAHKLSQSKLQLANTFYLTGRFSKAETTYREAIELAFLTKNTPHAFGIMTNLAETLRSLERAEEAESLYVQLLGLCEKDSALFKRHAKLILNNLAWAYFKQGKLTIAESTWVSAQQLHVTSNDTNSIGYARVIQNLGQVALYQGDIEKAKRLTDQAGVLWEESGGRPRDIIRNRQIRADVFWLSGEHETALDLHYKNFLLSKKSLKEVVANVSIRDAHISSRQSLYLAGRFLSCWLGQPVKSTEFSSEVAEVVLRSKGAVGDEVFNRLKLIRQRENPIFDSLVQLHTHLKQRLLAISVAKEVDSPQEQNELDSLTFMTDELERLLAERSSVFRRDFSQTTPGAKAVGTLLKKSDVLMEYIQIRMYEPNSVEAPLHYLVLTIKPDGYTTIVNLGEVEPIDSLVELYRAHMLQVSESNSPPTDYDKRTYTQIARALYIALIRPIEEQIPNNGMTIVAPDGGLNLISFASLIDNDGNYLIEKTRIHNISSGRDIIRLSEPTVQGEGLLLVADPDYDMLQERPASHADDELIAVAVAEDQHEESGLSRGRMSSLKTIAVTNLPGTRKEAGKVKAGWENAIGEPVVMLVGDQATEEDFRTRCSGRRMLYFATHGFFLNNAMLPENPLLQCGLLLAGANNGIAEMLEDQDHDGILTAYEVSGLDLTGVKTVVLSACESGLGKVEQGEGIYGLRRAFEMAGARTVVSTLWPVSDNLTSVMMGGLFNSNSTSTSMLMHQAQLDQIAKLRKADGWNDHPYSWAAFVTVGDWH